MVLFRVKGVPVKIGGSWLVIFALILWSLATALFPATYPGLAGSTYLLMATVATLLFLGSVLVHELSHTLRSLREGVPVREITLWLFGGVSRAEEPLPTPGAEFRVVFVGPLASAVLAVLFLALAAAGHALGLPDAVVGVPEYLARINGLLLAFNLVPALPLDGGRLLHALLWWRLKDSSTATIYAAGAGRAFAAALIAIGLFSVVLGNSFSGIWFLFLGWFLMMAVRQEVLSARATQAITGLRVRDLMSSRLVTVDPEMTIEEFADFLGRWPSHPAYPVLDRGAFVGMLVLQTAGGVPMNRRRSVRVAELMIPADQVPRLHPDDLAVDAVPMLGRDPGRAVVTDPANDHAVIGLLSATDLTRALETAPPRGTRRPRSRVGLVIASAAALVVVLAAAAIYHPPYVVVAPGRSFDVRGDVTISGVPVERPARPYLLTSVELSQPNTLGLLVSALRTDRQVLAASQVLPPGIDPSAATRFERDLFLDSQQAAAVAAATAAGYRARLTGAGAEVNGLAPSSPAAEVLQVGDVITAVDGTPIATASDLHEALAGRPAGQTITLAVERDGKSLRLEVQNARLPEVAGGTGIGVLVTTKDQRAVLPFRITFRNRPAVGGPSAGLAYALTITDMIDRKPSGGQSPVAATGTISPDGSVGPVGGVHEKAIAADEAGATVFVVPVSELGSVKEHQLEVYGVRDLKQAIGLLTP